MTNIFTDIFRESIQRLNPDLSQSNITNFYDEVALCLENGDLGKAFYEKLIEKSDKRLIDFKDFSNNTFNVVTELTYKKSDDEFWPDIILLINGMPLAFYRSQKAKQQRWHYRRTFDQIYPFSRMYWKSVRQKNLPVTIKYPEMIAKIAPHFEGDDIPEFGKDNLWFL